MIREGRGLVLVCALAGIALLVLLSTLQKLILGVPLTAASYLVPTAFGGLAGLGTGLSLVRTRQFAAQVARQRAELEGLVAERTAALEALRESEALYRAVFEQAAESILLFDVNTQRLVQFNDVAHRRLGYSREEFGRLTIADLDAALSPAEAEWHNARIQSQGTHTFETRHRAKGGELRDVLVSARAVSIGGHAYYLSVVRDITERKLTEQQSQESEARFRAIFEQAAVGIAQANLEGRYLRVNQRFCDLLGYSRQELLQLDFLQVSLRDELSHNLDLFHRALAGELDTYTLEKRYRRKSGETVSTHVSVTLVRDAAGAPRYFIAIAEDITDRKRAEEALRREHDFSAAVLDTTATLIVVLDRTGRIERFNRACELLTGYRSAEVRGRFPWDFLLVPEDVEPVREVFTRLAAGQFPSRFENEWVTRSRTRRTISWSNTALLDVRGEVEYVVATGLDITERKQAERHLRETRDYLQALYDASPDMIYLHGEDGALLDVNDNVCKVFGFSRADMLAADPRQLMGRDCSLDEALAHIERAQHGELVDFEWTARSKDGREFPVEVRLRALGGPGLAARGRVLAVVRDITERKRSEAALLQLSERNRLLLESAGEGIYGIDAEKRCIFINRAALEMLGYEREELIGRPLHGLIHHTRADGLAYPAEDCPIYRASSVGEGVRVSDEVLWRKDGTSFAAEYSAYPIAEQSHAGAVVVFRNTAEAQAMARKMDYLATHDTLTGLVNRHEFERRLEAALASARAEGSQHVLCYLDLDQFKVVNDTCGHVAGDELLRQLTALLHHHVRQGDTLGRLGGDEFGVLLERCPLDDALRVMANLQRTIQEFRFVWEQNSFAVGASVGMVAISEDAVSRVQILSAADAACYAAKESGRNRVHVYHPDDLELAQRHREMQWVARIQQALEQDRFFLRAQPIAPVQARADAGDCYEILIGLEDHAGNWVEPGAFLPAAERFGLIAAIDRWVFCRTLAWLEADPQRLERLALCTINLSGTSVADEHMLAFIVEAFGSHQVSAHKICFEITETAAIANLSRAVQFMQALKRLGCRFALDDFGSGMSSFAYLKNLPVDFLKIDGNFVRDVATDPVDRAMVQAIHQVGHVMQIQTIAEHVESEQILAVLREIGVDYAQGYGIARPQRLP